MNRSYSKIRHIQESNRILEKRILNEQSFEQSLLMGPLSSGWDFVKSLGPYLGFGVLATETGKESLKTMINQTPVGVLKNMSLAAARGDANSFSEAWKEAEKATKIDLSSIKDAAFKDMKNFGSLLQKLGIQ